MQTTNVSTTSQTAAPPTPSPEVSATDSSSDFKTFLTLLTAQMRNQDPLKPMDSTDFVAQLASFSAVEQQIETNSKLTELLGMFTNSPNANLSEWLGKEVRREGAASFDGRPIKIDTTVHASADEARLVVRDKSSVVIHTQQFDPDSDTATWDGSTQGTSVAPNGRYSFEVESYKNGKLVDTSHGSVFDLVTEVRLDQGNTVLIFEDGAPLQANDATAVRMPRS